MPRGGKRDGAGRKTGSVNESTAQAHETMARLGVDPIELMALIAARRVTCGTCIDKNGKPTGETYYTLAEGDHSRKCAITKAKGKKQVACTCLGIGTRVCESCWGILRERINVTDMLKASAELAQYKHAKRKAIEHTGPEGGPIQFGVRVISVKANGNTG